MLIWKFASGLVFRRNPLNIAPGPGYTVRPGLWRHAVSGGNCYMQFPYKVPKLKSWVLLSLEKFSLYVTAGRPPKPVIKPDHPQIDIPLPHVSEVEKPEGGEEEAIRRISLCQTWSVRLL